MEKILFTTLIAVFLMTVAQHTPLAIAHPEMGNLEQVVYSFVTP